MQTATEKGSGAQVAGVRRQLRPKEVAQLLGISKSTLWNWVRQGRFPRPVKMTSTTTVFFADEVADWQKQHLMPEV